MIISLVGLAAVLVLAFLGVPLGIVMILVGMVGFAVAKASIYGESIISLNEGGLQIGWAHLDAAFVMMGQQVFDVATSPGLTVLPLFVLMGAFIHRSRLSEDLYEAAAAFLGHRKGGMAMATVTACGAFAAVCGSSLAVAATMSRVAMPSLRRLRYADSLSTGSIAAGGTLGILIPPSVPMVIYGLLSDTDIASLFIAGIVPGLLLMLAFLAAIAIVVRANPELGPPGEFIPFCKRFAHLGKVWGVVALFILIIGGIYLGVFTPTEAGGIGAAGAFFLGLARRRLTFRDTVEALVESGITTGMVFLVIMGALIFSNFLSLAGLTDALQAFVVGLGANPLVVVLAICLIYLILGCVFDSIAMLVLTVPIFAAVLSGLGVDLVWFGIIAVITVEMGLITPPVGMIVFVVSSETPGVSVWTVFSGIWPFLIAMVLTLAAVIIFPGIATWLPSLM